MAVQAWRRVVETSCSVCHDANHAFSDGLRHEVSIHPAGAGGSLESFDTPSLRFVAGTAPYFHDGRYQSLDEVAALRRHRDWEQIPSLRMLDEQVRVKEER